MIVQHHTEVIKIFPPDEFLQDCVVDQDVISNSDTLKNKNLLDHITELEAALNQCNIHKRKIRELKEK